MTDMGGSQRGHRPTQPRAVQWPGTFLMARVWVDREVNRAVPVILGKTYTQTSNIRRNSTTKFLRLPKLFNHSEKTDISLGPQTTMIKGKPLN